MLRGKKARKFKKTDQVAIEVIMIAENVETEMTVVTAVIEMIVAIDATVETVTTDRIAVIAANVVLESAPSVAVTVKVSDNSKIKFEKASITQVFGGDDGPEDSDDRAEANDGSIAST